MEKSDGECPGMLIPRVDATYLFIRVIVGEAEGKSERQTPLEVGKERGKLVKTGKGRKQDSAVMHACEIIVMTTFIEECIYI